MNRISGLEERIRAHVNDAFLYEGYFTDDLNTWQTLCAAMDILGDTCLALLQFEENGIGRSLGEKYINLYGLFQSFILQQDSIKELHDIFVGTKLNLHDIDEFEKLRRIRNMMTGHPISKHGLRTYLSRPTMNDNGFELISWNVKTSQNEVLIIHLPTLYSPYKDKAVELLETTSTNQIKRFPRLKEYD